MVKKKDELSVFRKYFWWGQTSSQAHMPENTPHAFEKLVFGTDEDPKDLDKVIAQYTRMLEACQVPETVRRKVFAETMARILGLSEMAPTNRTAKKGP